MRIAPLAMLALLALPASAGTPARAWDFRVLLDAREIGRHRFSADSDGSATELRSDAQFAVRVLFVDAYRYSHRARERWNGDCLESLASRTETNAGREAVLGRREDDAFVVDRPGGRDVHRGCVMSFAYWNPRILEASHLLNSQTGALVPVTVARLGGDAVVVRGQRRDAQRYRISGPDLAVDLWYADSDWVALESHIAGGRRLRYELL